MGGMSLAVAEECLLSHALSMTMFIVMFIVMLALSLDGVSPPPYSYIHLSLKFTESFPRIVLCIVLPKIYKVLIRTLQMSQWRCHTLRISYWPAFKIAREQLIMLPH